MNSTLYQCHLKANKAEYGYSGRMKMIWKERMPEYAQLTSKHLTTQVTRVINKGLIKETKVNQSRNQLSTMNSDNGIDYEEQSEVVQEEGDPPLETSDTSEPNNDNINVPEVPEENIELNRMIDEIKPEWIKNYEKYLNINIELRQYQTRKDRKIEDIELIAANKIMEEIIQNDESIDLWKINVMQYTTATTLLDRHGKLREKKNTRKEKKTPGWISNFENKINAIRRKLSHVTLILNCKDHRKLTTKQLNIRRKLQKMYGSVKTTRLQEIKAQLTHELRVQSKILRDKKKIHEI